MKNQNKILKQFTNYVDKSDLPNDLNQLVKYMFASALNDYIISITESKKNGYFVESYNQKYLNPAIKLKAQSFKEIVKILQMVRDNQTQPNDEDILKNIMMLD